MKLIPNVFFRGALLSTGSAILVGVFGYLTRRTLANNLPENDYAFFYSMFALINFSLIFIQFGTAEVLLFEVPRWLEAGAKRCASTGYKFIKKFQSINSVVCILLFLVCFPFLKKYYFSYPVSPINFVLFVLLLWGFSLENTTLFALNTFKRFGLISGLRLIKSGLFFAAACLSLLGGQLSWIIFLIVLATTFCTLAGDFAVRQMGMIPTTCHTPVKLKKKIVHSGLIFMLLACGNNIAHDVGTITLGFVSTAQEVVLFNIALPIAMIIQSMMIILNVFTPMIAESWAKGEKRQLKRLFNRLFLFTVAAMIIAVPVIVFGGDLLITLLFSKKFIGAKWSTLFLVEAALLSVPIRALLSFFNTIDKKNISLKTLFPTAGAVILLFPVLSRVYGATGAGLAAFLSTVVWLSAYLFYYRRLINE